MDRTFYDVAFIGCGLSGSEVICELLCELGRAPLGRVIKVCAIDRLGHFARGPAYSDLSPKGSLMIESVAQSTPVEFHDWLIAKSIASASHESPWVRRNAAKIDRRQWNDLYAPRHLFGDFQEQKFDSQIRQAAKSGLASVSLLVDKSIGLTPLDRAWEVKLLSGRHLSAKLVILSCGSIPRVPQANVSASEGYIEDPYTFGFDNLRKRILSTPEHRLTVAIVGANASAVEVIFWLESDSMLKSKIGRLLSISPQGYLLPGGLSSGPEVIPHHPRCFPSAPQYIRIAKDSIQEGRLMTIKGEVRAYEPSKGGMTLECSNPASTIGAHWVVNCTGAGRMSRHSSPLLTNLQGQVPHRFNDLDRGFELVPESFMIQGACGIYVMGPLLNGETSDTFVESVDRIYSLAPQLAIQLKSALTTGHFSYKIPSRSLRRCDSQSA